MRLMLGSTLLAILTVLAPASAQPQQDDPKASQKKVEEMIRQLDQKMDDLSKVLREKGQIPYADKLEQAREKLKSSVVNPDDPQDTYTLQTRIESVMRQLDSKQIERALGSGEDVAKLLQSLLDLLEDRTDPKEREKQKKALEAAIQQLKAIQKEEDKVKEETEKINRDREKDYDQVRQDLQKLIDDQQKLQSETEQGVPRDL